MSPSLPVRFFIAAASIPCELISTDVNLRPMVQEKQLDNERAGGETSYCS